MPVGFNQHGSNNNIANTDTAHTTADINNNQPTLTDNANTYPNSRTFNCAQHACSQLANIAHVNTNFINYTPSVILHQQNKSSPRACSTSDALYSCHKSQTCFRLSTLHANQVPRCNHVSLCCWFCSLQHGLWEFNTQRFLTCIQIQA